MATIDDISKQITESQKWASDAIDAANTAIDQLQNTTFKTYPTYPDPLKLGDSPKNIDVGKNPLTPPMFPNISAFTGVYTPGNIDNPSDPYSPVNGTVKPTVNIPNAPSSALPNTPVAPTPSAVPDPIFSPIPSLPALPEITTPKLASPPAISLPTFTKNSPTTKLSFQGGGFDYVEAEYSDDVLTRLDEFMLSKLDGGTGLNKDVEKQIWDRERAREVAVSEGEMLAAAEDASALGFSSPTGTMMRRIAIASEEMAAKAASASRDIAIKQAELEQANDKEFSQMAIQLEGIKIQHADNVAARALDVAKSVVELGIQTFNAYVGQYNAELARYKVDAEVFSSEINAALAAAEVYKTQIEAGKLEYEIQSLYVDLYKAQLSGINSAVEVQRNQVDIQKSQVSVENLKIEQFRSQVQAYQSQVQAKVSEFNMFSAQIEGEKVKSEVYAADMRGYEIEVDAYRASVDANKTKVDKQIEIEKMKLEAFDKEVSAYKLNLETDKANILSISAGFKDGVTARDSDVNAQIEQSKMNLAIYSEASRISMANLNIELSKVSDSYSKAIEQISLTRGSMEATAKITADLAAAASSGMNTILKIGDDTLTQK